MKRACFVSHHACAARAACVVCGNRWAAALFHASAVCAAQVPAGTSNDCRWLQPHAASPPCSASRWAAPSRSHLPQRLLGLLPARLGPRHPGVHTAGAHRWACGVWVWVWRGACVCGVVWCGVVWCACICRAAAARCLRPASTPGRTPSGVCVASAVADMQAVNTKCKQTAPAAEDWVSSLSLRGGLLAAACGRELLLFRRAEGRAGLGAVQSAVAQQRLQCIAMV